MNISKTCCLSSYASLVRWRPTNYYVFIQPLSLFNLAGTQWRQVEDALLNPPAPINFLCCAPSKFHNAGQDYMSRCLFPSDALNQMNKKCLPKLIQANGGH